MNERTDPARLLRRSLRANAAFSAVSGVTLAAGSTLLTPWLGLPTPWIAPAIGVGLLGFAAYVAHTVRQDRIDRAAVRSIIASDAAWVLGTVGLLALLPDTLSEAGRWSAIAVADVVLALAILQTIGLRRVPVEPSAATAQL